MRAPAYLDRDERAAVAAFDRAIRRFHVLVARARLFGGVPSRRLTIARVAVEEACFVANATMHRHTRWVVALGRARTSEKRARWFA